MSWQDGQDPWTRGDEGEQRAEAGRVPAPGAGPAAASPNSNGHSHAGPYGHNGNAYGQPQGYSGQPQGYPGNGYAYSAEPPRPVMHDLRPLSTGEILDRTFTLYRSRVWLFAGIASVAAVIEVIASGAQMVGLHGMVRNTIPLGAGAQAGAGAAMLARSGEAILISYAAAFIYFLAASVTHAGTAWALSEVYLGRSAAVGTALRFAARRWLAWIGIGLWQAFSFLWMPLVLGIAAAVSAGLIAARGGVALWVVPVLLIFGMLGGIVFGAIRYLMNSLALPAGAIEGLPVRAAMRRSKVLSAGTKGRIFLVLLVVWAMYLVAGMVQAPLSFLFLRSPNESHIVAQGIMLLIGFVAHMVVAPVMMIGLTLVYFDQRVRNEAFDLVMLMSEAETVPVAPAV